MESSQVPCGSLPPASSSLSLFESFTVFIKSPVPRETRVSLLCLIRPFSFSTLAFFLIVERSSELARYGMPAPMSEERWECAKSSPYCFTTLFRPTELVCQEYQWRVLCLREDLSNRLDSLPKRKKKKKKRSQGRKRRQKLKANLISHPELNPDGPSRLGPLLDLLSIVSLSLSSFSSTCSSSFLFYSDCFIQTIERDNRSVSFAFHLIA